MDYRVVVVLNREECHIKIKSKENLVIGAILLLMIVFLFSRNFLTFFRIIKDYIVGDLILTYDDFPDIGDWLQITTTVLFSYLLVRSNIKSNEISKNSLDLQKDILEEQRNIRRNESIIRLSDLQRGIVFYIGELNKNQFNLNMNGKLGEIQYNHYLGQCIQIIEIHSNKIYTIIPEIKNISEYIHLRNKISTHEMDLQNIYIEKFPLKEQVEELINGLLENLKLLNNIVIGEIDEY